MKTTNSAGDRRQNGRNAAGFTLLELLVITATLGVLSLLLLPALAGARTNSQAMQCLNNVRSLTSAWSMYASDSQDQLVKASSWVSSSHYMEWSLGSGVTNTAILLDPTQSLIAGYVKSAAIFKCPADRFLSPAQYDAGWKQRTRSYSLNGAVGGRTLVIQPGYPPGRVYPATGAAKMSELSMPGPANILVFLDEHPDSINDGAFMFDAGFASSQYKWRDLPGSHHDGSGVLSFADGHCQVKAWEERISQSGLSPTVQPVSYIDMSPLYCRNSRDYLWMNDRMPYREE